MEEAGGVVPADLALSPFRATGVLPQAVRLLGRKVVSAGYDEVVFEIEGFVLATGEYNAKFGQGGANLLDRPFYFVCKHSVHGWDDLYWHVDQPL